MTFKNIKKEAKALYKADMAKIAGTGFVAAVIKYALPLALFTVQFISLQKYQGEAGTLLSLALSVAYFASVLFIFLPVTVGMGTYYTGVSKAKEIETDDIFCVYRSFGKNGVASIVPFAAIVIELAVLGMVLSLCKGFGEGIGYTVLISVIFGVLQLAAVIYTLIAYSPVSYVISKYNGIQASTVLSRALRISKGKRGKIFLFYLSFTPYFLLSVLTLGIGLIWLLPYIHISSKLLMGELEK